MHWEQGIGSKASRQTRFSTLAACALDFGRDDDFLLATVEEGAFLRGREWALGRSCGWCGMERRSGV